VNLTVPETKNETGPEVTEGRGRDVSIGIGMNADLAWSGESQGKRQRIRTGFVHRTQGRNEKARRSRRRRNNEPRQKRKKTNLDKERPGGGKNAIRDPLPKLDDPSAGGRTPPQRRRTTFRGEVQRKTGKARL